jgi:hypothetical protein
MKRVGFLVLLNVVLGLVWISVSQQSFPPLKTDLPEKPWERPSSPPVVEASPLRLFQNTTRVETSVASPEKPEAPPSASWQLIGIARDAPHEGIAVFQTPSGVQKVRVGDALCGGTVQSMSRTVVVLQRGSEITHIALNEGAAQLIECGL